MKKAIGMLISLLLPLIGSAQQLPHTFQDGDLIYAEEINANFEYLLKRAAIRKTTVDCNAGETINAALEKYNHLVISGTCNENISLEYPQTPQAVLILEGASGDAANDKIVAASSDNATVSIFGPVHVQLSNLTFSGGARGLNVVFSPLVQVKGCVIESNSYEGIWVGDTTIFVSESTIRNNSQESGNGIGIYANSIGILENNTIENHPNGSGIEVGITSSAFITGNTISGAKYQAISVKNSSTADIGETPDGDGNSRGNTITGPFERGIYISDNSQAELIANTITGYSRTGIEVKRNSSVKIGSNSSSSSYTTSERANYGNTLDGTALSGQTVEDWQWGFRIAESSTVQLHRNLVENHQQGGVYAERESVVILGGGNIVQDNMRTNSSGDVEGSGFEMRRGSMLEMWSDAQEREPNTISGNGRYAFRAESSELDLRGGDDGNTQNNRLVISGHQYGIRAGRGSKVTLERVDVQDNETGGIRIQDGSVLSVYDDGITVTGNGLQSGACHNDSDYALTLQDNSVAKLDRITVSNNCYGIRVETNSTLEGGWAASSDSSLEYGIVVQGNLKEGIEVKRNSVLNVDYLLLGGSGSQEGNNSDSQDDALDVSRNSFAEVEHSRIEGNHGRAIEVEDNSNLSLEDTTITGNNASSSYSREAIYVANLSKAQIRQSTISSGTAQGIQVYKRSILRLEETNVTVDASLVSDTYSTAIRAYGSDVEVSNYSGNTYALSSSAGPEIFLRQSRLSLSGYRFDSSSSERDVDINDSLVGLQQMPDGQTFTAFLGEGSELHTEHTFSSEVISDLACSQGTYQNGIQLKPPGVAYLYNNEESIIGSTSSCMVRNDNTPHEDPPSNGSVTEVASSTINWGTNGAYQNVVVYTVDKGTDTLGTINDYSSFCTSKGKNYISSTGYPAGGNSYSSSDTSSSLFVTAKNYFENTVQPAMPAITHDNLLVLHGNSDNCFAHNAETGSMHAFGGPEGTGYSFCRGGTSASKRFHMYICQ